MAPQNVGNKDRGYITHIITITIGIIITLPTLSEYPGNEVVAPADFRDAPRCSSRVAKPNTSVRLAMFQGRSQGGAEGPQII